MKSNSHAESFCQQPKQLQKTTILMGKKIILLASLFLTITAMQAQSDRKQPKPGPAPTVNVGKPQRFTLPNGLKVLVVENNKLPRVSFNLQIDNAPFAEGNKKGIDDLTSTMMGKGTTKISKDAFNEEIDFLGADINFSSDGAYASALSKYSGRVMELMALGALNPNFTQPELDKEKAKLIEGLKSGEKSVAAVMGRVENYLAFGKNHPNGEYLTEQTINNVSLNDLVQHYNTYFVPENAYLVVIGDVKFADVKTKVEEYFGGWAKDAAPQLSYSDPKNVQYTQINFVDMPNAVQSEISVVNTVNLKMTDKDYFAALVANQVLGGDFNSYLNMNLREKHGWTYGARSSVSGNKYVTKFKATSQVRNVVTDSAVVEFVNELKRIRKDKVTDEVLSNVKAGFIGKFVMQIEKPETVARYAVATETQKLPADFYENYIKSINAVTADDVLRVANKYFLADNCRIIVVGKGSDVLAGLEKLKIPIFLFDKYGNPVEKTKEKKLGANITVQSVIDKYVAAIGGEKAVKAVKTTATKATATVQNVPMEMTTKVSADGKSKVEMVGMGMTLMKQVVGDKMGYMEQQGQRKEYDAAKLAEEKAEAQPFPELALSSKAGVTLLPIQNIEGKEAYAIKDGKTTYYFDITSGLKIAANKVVEANGQTISQTVNYDNYKEVNGIKFPFKTTMNVGFNIELTTTEIKVNEGVTDADFQ
jgi:zinc protease